MRTIVWSLMAGMLCFGQDWPRFRGPNGSGVSNSAGIPAEFGPSRNLLWRITVPFGRYSPVIAGDSIFITASEGDKLIVMSLNRATGKLRWRREIVRTRTTSTLKANDPASASPATDGKNVNAFFMDFGLVSYAPDGKERWRLPLGPFQTFYGLGTSPVVVGNTLLLVCDTKKDAFLVAVDTETGRPRWRVDRPEVRGEGYMSPMVYEPPGQAPQTIVIGPQMNASPLPRSRRARSTSVRGGRYGRSDRENLSPHDSPGFGARWPRMQVARPGAVQTYSTVRRGVRRSAMQDWNL